MIRGCRKQRRERGVAMVEFMIVLPVVLFIMFGVTEIGRVLIRYNTLTKALQDGARHASVYGLAGSTQVVNIDAALNNEIRNLVVYGNTAGTGTPLLDGLIPGQVTVTVPQAGWIQVDAPSNSQSSAQSRCWSSLRSSRSAGRSTR
jgi:Flp pilus assembly protein TadG